ncbi:hypothetical protein N7448_010676 [Penicillium atrosanguineum]|uniref:AB hydrolase-1 domain-containing protein n=1 Tax=Penicillium atrosanguineum TaxID=1132637 RepID=A0A9W9U1H4_9EURO|nr:uncharacterized protein N7443_007898 [Penicillium atrosanguineum]KAJ5118968.1 hypothetical protein N7526_010605 [Penicillium atrosanguineum]KAJ5120007.1 hypothetical protein N7448_010676 [Penicillium atrosanguineum]KAJ5297005.1 hypothetical protein N7443_007898 [Penicillium atrosanguineum]KAJ5299765.1 hypothetical protein N7476_011322 [Penicillium atrosanguineum]
MSSPFQVAEHVIDGQYIREYPRATATPDAPLKLCIKQYTPVDNPNPQPGDITIVATHGTGFPKELYEPLWEELLARSKEDGVRIRSIWIADAANQGASGVINEQNLGNDPSWYDHSRDVIHMINHFRAQMTRPIVGIGHSLGATQLVFASLMHPRLFNSLVLIEPHMTDNALAGDGPLFVAMSTKKRDVWPSREEAAENSLKVLKAWDSRVFELWKKYGYRDLPTAMYPAPKDGTRPVTLTTTKHQETIMYTRPNVKRHTQLGVPQPQAYTEPKPGETGPPPHDPLLFPDVLGPLLPDQKSYRSESILAYKMVEHIRPSVLYVSASHSPLGKGGEHADAARRTGTRFGGSGGMEAGRVQYVRIKKAGHTVPQEKVAETASVLGPWIKQEIQRWQEDEARISEDWRDRPIREKSGLPLDWNEVIGSLRLPKRPAKI